MKTKCIVHPTDFSSAAEPAFQYAREAAQRDGAELILVHVIEPVSGLGDEMYLAPAIELQEAAEVAARQGFGGLPVASDPDRPRCGVWYR